MQNPQKPKRAYGVGDSVMLVAAATIADSAIAHQTELLEADTMLTADYLRTLRTGIDNAARDILGADNAADLRKQTTDLEKDHGDATRQLSLTKVLIETRYATNTARRDELLNTLGLQAYYTDAAKGRQEAMGQLLSRFSQNLTPELEAELTTAGLPAARIATLRSYSATYSNKNASQEGAKDTRKELTAGDVHTLNGIYNTIVGLCATARRVFRGNAALAGRFSFGHVSGQQSSFHDDHISAPPPPNPPVAG